jgi:alpha-N-arabinofuranosidase
MYYQILSMTRLKQVLPVFVGCLYLSNLFAQNARIKIDVDRTIGEVNKHLYGNFVEHLGRCVYRGFMIQRLHYLIKKVFEKM